MNQILILICLLISFGNISSRLANFCVKDEEDCYYKEISLNEDIRKHEELINKKLRNEPSIYDFMKKAFIGIFKYQTEELYKYINGFKYIMSTIYKIYSHSANKNTLKEFSSIIKPKIDHNIDMRNINSKKVIRNLNERIFTIIDNNTDLYNDTICPTSPNIKANATAFYCNSKMVNKTTYDELSKDEKNKCKKYINIIIKICICPITYSQCSKPTIKLYCDINHIYANDGEYNLTKFRNTFYQEYFNHTVLPLSKNNFNFNIGFKCATEDPKNKNDNFFLGYDKNLEYEVLSTEYEDGSNGTQYTKEEVSDPKTEILKYFMKDEHITIYEKMELEIIFSIYDLQWILPQYQKRFPINIDNVMNILEGSNITISVNLNELLQNKTLVLPDKYQKMQTGDLLFYEIKLVSTNQQDILEAFSFRGDINIMK